MAKYKFGLIGQGLKHSASSRLFYSLGIKDYKLLDFTEKEVVEFIQEKNFLGLNITMPYKKTVIPYLNSLSEIAEKTGVVNTIVNEKGILKGYNGDYHGFKYLLEFHSLDLHNSKILIFGNGATATTVREVLKSIQGTQVKVLRRGEILSDTSFDCIINTTPVGMYPASNASITNLEKFLNLKLVIDLIYNPLSTQLLLEAKNNGLNYYNGLAMLVGQACFAFKKFTSKTVSDPIKLYKYLKSKLSNIVLIGMPTAGKSTLALRLPFDKEVVDTDQVIEARQQMSIKDIIEKQGLDYFRSLERDLIKELSHRKNLIIACGGGIGVDKSLMDLLQQNGLVFFIDRKFQDLIPDINRPLINTEDKLKKVYHARYKHYLKNSSIIIHDKTLAESVLIIKEKYNEYLSH